MEINFTSIIEKSIKDLIKGKRGDQIANLYHKYWNPINFAIIGVIGILIYLICSPFQVLLGTTLGGALAVFIAWFWIWINSVGPYGYMWGFKAKEKKEKIIKTERLV